MKLTNNGITVEVTHPADIDFYKKAGYKEVPAKKTKAEGAPEKSKEEQPIKKEAEKAGSE
jgi:predicted acetyltransferase